MTNDKWAEVREAVKKEFGVDDHIFADSNKPGDISCPVCGLDLYANPAHFDAEAGTSGLYRFCYAVSQSASAAILEHDHSEEYQRGYKAGRDDALKEAQTTGLHCPLCGAYNSFAISPLDPSVGYCFKEAQAWAIKPGKAVCHVCLKVVPTRYCELCDLRYCNEGEDDDRPCAIEHDNRHEDRTAAS